ncbi:MAG: hypothetical protein Q9171_002661 [Xanthocarpia ochracea]
MALIFAQLEILFGAILHQLSNLHTDTSDISSTSSTDNIQIMTSFLAATMAESGRVPTPVDPIFPLDDCYSHIVGIPQTVHPRPHNVAPAQPRQWANPWGLYWGHPVGCYAHLSHSEQLYVESDRCVCPGSRKIKAQRITRATYGDHGVIGEPIASPNRSRDELPLDIDQEPSQASSSPVEPRSTDASDPADSTRATTGGSSHGANDKNAGSPFSTTAANDANDNGVDGKDSSPVHADAAIPDNAADATTSAAQLRAKQMAFLARVEQEEWQAEQLAIQQARQLQAEQLAEQEAARQAYQFAVERRRYWIASGLGALSGVIVRTTDRGQRTWLQAIMEQGLSVERANFTPAERAMVEAERAQRAAARG